MASKEGSMSLTARTVLAAAILSFGFSGVAFARNDTLTARLAQPAAAARVIAGNAVWTCANDTCAARVNSGPSVHSCREFVREAGAAVTSYGSEQQQLSAAQLASCNASAPSTQIQQAQN